MKAIHSLLGAGRHCFIVHKIVLPKILESGGHLFEVVNLGPPFIGRAFALGHALLNVYNQIHTPGRSRGLVRELRDGPLPGNHRLNIRQVKAILQSGGTQAGGLILPRGKKGNHAAPPMLYRKAGLLHKLEKCRKVGGLLFQSRNDGKAYPLLGRRGPLPDPLAIV